MVPPADALRLRLRGRHLLALDVAIAAGAYALLAITTRQPQAVGWPWAVVVVATILVLIQLGTYQHVRTLGSRGEVARLGLANIVGGVLAYETLAFRDPNAATLTEFGVAHALVAFGIMVAYRVWLAAMGWRRLGPADEAPVMSVERDRVPGVLHAMMAALNDAPAIYQPSRFWQSLSRRHVAILSTANGFNTFKRTLNTSYFQFGLSTLASSMYRLLREWIRSPDASVWSARPAEARLGGKFLAVLVALYANAVRARPHGDLIDVLREPSLGAPIEACWGQRVLTEDLCHSVEEYDTIVSRLPPGIALRRVIEFGAGYGRLAWVFASARPDVQYYIVDIPPALYVSQRYLTEARPTAKAFLFRTFADYREVAHEIQQAQLVFLEPQQLELLPDRCADLVLTISTLHEMRSDQVRHFLDTVDRLSGGAFYSKQWKRFYNHADATTHHQRTYPIPKSWRLIYSGTPIVPGSFFEDLYVCHPSDDKSRV